MKPIPEWWQKPRRISIIVDRKSWALPDAEDFCRALVSDGDEASIYHAANNITEGDVAFFLGSEQIVSAVILALNHRNLVVHASDLPKGRGFSPLTWLTLEGETRIPVCLFEAVEALDAGPVIFREFIEFSGHELVGEMRLVLGRMQIDFCRRFLASETPPEGVAQVGEPTTYPRRTPDHSALDCRASLESQFNLLRTVDNEKYPAFFDMRGHRYKILIEKVQPEGSTD